MLERAYLENATLQPANPHRRVPALLAESLPVHAWVTVDVFVTGCPPSADRIFEVIIGPARRAAPERWPKSSRFG